MYRQHFGLRCAPLDTDSSELWDDGALAHLSERFQWLLLNRSGFVGDRRVWRYAARAESAAFRL